MVDGVKIFISGHENFKDILQKSGNVDLKTPVSLFSGETKEYPMKGKFFNMDVVINLVTTYLSGSLHKLNNQIKERGNQNFDDYYFDDLKETVTLILDDFQIWGKTSLTQLEFGFNICVSKNPKSFIHENLLMFNYADHNKDLNYRGKGKHKEYHMTDYSMKIYDKSKQNSLNENLLRVEIRLLSKRLLRKLGVSKLEDLLRLEVLRLIYSQLINELNKCIIVDDYSLENVDAATFNKLNLYTNPNFWIKSKKQKTPKQVYHLKKNFQMLIRKNSLDTLKREILEKCSLKFQQLTNCCSDNQNVA